MKVVKQMLKNGKLSLFLNEDNSCIQAFIFNYQDVLDFSDCLLELPFAKIKGHSLLITRMEEDNLEITGTIETIEFQKKEKEE